MTANPRKPGFRLPWVPEEADGTGNPKNPHAPASDAAPVEEQDAAAAPSPEGAEPDPTAASAAEEGGEESSTETEESSTETPEDGSKAQAEDATAAEAPTSAEAAAEPQAPAASETAPSDSAASDDFLRELVAAMRGVADQARQNRLGQLRGAAEEQVQRVQSTSEERAAELRRLVEADVAGIGEWAKTEAERIRAEAESRVGARRDQLDQQLAADTRRAEQEVAAVRARVAQYERELEVYYTQLAEINDPAAFAAAAKRIPGAPHLAAAEVAASATPPSDTDANPGAATSDATLAGRLAELDARLEEKAAASGRNASRPGAPPAAAAAGSTAIIVKGLASFGAITGFRQALAAVDGIDGVQLSLGPTGEFVYRATHAEDFDVGAAITRLEGDQAQVERDQDGTLRVTVTRGR